MRSHKNSKARLTARERAELAFVDMPTGIHPNMAHAAIGVIQLAIASAVRAALARKARRG